MIETVALAGSVVGYLIKTIKDNKDVNNFFSDFTSATVDWLRPIFLKEDGLSTELFEDLKTAPDDALFQESVKLEVAKLVKKNPQFEELLKSLVAEITEKEGRFTSGYSVTQTHFGSGDNIGRDKYVQGGH